MFQRSLHQTCKLYGQRPSELLLGDSADLQIDMHVANVGMAYENAEALKARKRNGITR